VAAPAEPTPAEPTQGSGHTEGRAARFTLIAALYVSQAVPIGFFVLALPAILKSEGVPLAQVGLVGALALAFPLKFLWAPLVDRYGSRRRGHYRSWILPLQALSALSVVALSTLDVERHFLPMIVLGAVFMLLAATQDVATDGLAVHVLAREERGLGNGIQVGGYYLGQILGGGAVLMLVGRLGWGPSLLAMAVVLALPLFAALVFREPPSTGYGRARAGLDFAALARFFRRPGNKAWALVLLLFRVGESMALFMGGPLLVTRGRGLDEIALGFAMMASVAALVGSLAGGAVINRLGRKPSLLAFGVAEIAALVGLAGAVAGGGGESLLYASLMLVALTGGLGTTALYTSMMDRATRATAATDFSLQQSLAAFGPIAGTVLSGMAVTALGYPAFFLLCAGMVVVAVGAVVGGLRPEAVAVGEEPGAEVT